MLPRFGVTCVTALRELGIDDGRISIADDFDTFVLADFRAGFLRYLRDTNAWLWMVGASGNLGAQTKALLREAHHELTLSVASAWKIVIKFQIGKLTYRVDYIASSHTEGRFRLFGNTAA